MSCSTANSPWRSKYSPPHMQLLPESMHSRAHTHRPDYHGACMFPHPPCSKGVLVSVAPAALLVQPLVVVHTLERLGTSGGLQNNRQQQSRAEHSMADNVAQAYTVCFRTSGENTAATLQGRAHRCGGKLLQVLPCEVGRMQPTPCPAQFMWLDHWLCCMLPQTLV